MVHNELRTINSGHERLTLNCGSRHFNDHFLARARSDWGLLGGGVHNAARCPALSLLSSMPLIISQQCRTSCLGELRWSVWISALPCHHGTLPLDEQQVINTKASIQPIEYCIAITIKLPDVYNKFSKDELTIWNSYLDNSEVDGIATQNSLSRKLLPWVV